MINWELCQKLKFDHPDEWYMHNLESVLENETQIILLDFEIQTDHLLSARRLHLVIEKKVNSDLWTLLSRGQRSHDKKKTKRKIILTLLENWKKLWNMKMTVMSVVVTKILIKYWRVDLEISRDYSNYSIVQISQNTKKSHGDLRRFALTQTPAEEHKLRLVWKKIQRSKIIIIMIIIMRARPDGQIYRWPGLTTKRHMTLFRKAG